MTKRSQTRKRELYGIDSDGHVSGSVVSPVNTTAPSISGLGKVGSPETCNPGIWTGSYARASYQWKVNGVNIPGATQAGYTPQASDATKSLTCLVTATNPAGSAQLGSNSVVVAP